jgi:hypothetical protein
MIILYKDLLEYIKYFLTYKERIQFLLLCKHTSYLQLDKFYPYIVCKKNYPYNGYVLFYNPFYHINKIPIRFNFFIDTYLNIIIYDSPYTYYNIRICEEYKPQLTLYDYLKKYKSKKYYINKIIKYID